MRTAFRLAGAQRQQAGGRPWLVGERVVMAQHWEAGYIRTLLKGLHMSTRRLTPKNHQTIARQYPRFMAALDALGEEAANAGPLAEKTRHLVQIGAAAAIRSEGAVHSHTRRALAAGATPEEVRHAVIAATSTIGFPNVMAALSWINDVAGRARR
jgi:4-carboxymuconolactone decarboxylase